MAGHRLWGEYAMRMLFLAAIGLGLAAPVAAAAPPSVLVTISDLDLGTADGQAALDGRLRRAAHQVCTFTRLRDLHEQRLADRCAVETLARAKATQGTLIASNGAIMVTGQ
jgi:UrcA family protein